MAVTASSFCLLWTFAAADMVPMEAWRRYKGMHEIQIVAHHAPLLQCIGMALAFFGFLMAGSARKWSARDDYVYLLIVLSIHEALSSRIIFTMRRRICSYSQKVLPV